MKIPFEKPAASLRVTGDGQQTTTPWRTDRLPQAQFGVGPCVPFDV